MRRVPWFVAGLILGAAGMFTSMRYYAVRADDGMHLIPKATAELTVPYVDIRNFDVEDWNEHRDLALAISKADKAHLLQDSVANQVQQAMDSVMTSLTGDRDAEVR